MIFNFLFSIILAYCVGMCYGEAYVTWTFLGSFWTIYLIVKGVKRWR